MYAPATMTDAQAEVRYDRQCGVPGPGGASIVRDARRDERLGDRARQAMRLRNFSPRT